MPAPMSRRRSFNCQRRLWNCAFRHRDARWRQEDARPFIRVTRLAGDALAPPEAIPTPSLDRSRGGAGIRLTGKRRLSAFWSLESPKTPVAFRAIFAGVILGCWTASDLDRAPAARGVGNHQCNRTAAAGKPLPFSRAINRIKLNPGTNHAAGAAGNRTIAGMPSLGLPGRRKSR